MSKAKASGRDYMPMIHATFVTRRNAPSNGFLLFWGAERPDEFDWTAGLARAGLGNIPESHLSPAEARMILPARDGRYRIETIQGRSLPIAEALHVLCTATFTTDGRSEAGKRRRTTCSSVVAWSFAAKFALELIARQCFVPTVKTNNHELFAVWQAALESSIDIGRVRQLASAMPVCAHALYSIPHNKFDSHHGGGNARRRRLTMMWHPEALIRAFLDTAIDGFIRNIMHRPENSPIWDDIREKLSSCPQPVISRPLPELMESAYGLVLSQIKELANREIDSVFYPDRIPEHTEINASPSLKQSAANILSEDEENIEDDADDASNARTLEDDEDGEGESEYDGQDDGQDESQDDGQDDGPTDHPENRQRTAVQRSILREAYILAQNGNTDARRIASLKYRMLHQLMPLKEFVHITTAPFNTLSSWETRWCEALLGDKSKGCMQYHLEDPNLVDAMHTWLIPIHENDSTQEIDARTGFWLEVPSSETDNMWLLRYMLVAIEDPSIAISASLVFSIGTEKFRIDQHAFENPQEQLLTDLGRAAQYFEPLRQSLNKTKPEGVLLDVKQAWTFISEVCPLLMQQGFDVRLPEQLTNQGAHRLRARFRIRDVHPDDAMHGGHFGLNDLAGFQWEAALGDESVSVEEFEQIVALKQPLVQWHGSWVLVDPAQLRDIATLIEQNESHGTLTRFDAMNRVLSGVADPNNPNSNVEVVVEGKIADILDRLTKEDIADLTLKAPSSFVGRLRPYQERGVAWLAYQQRLGLGCCLADDMGLGKTIQLICHILNQIQKNPRDCRGTLLICPMSVVGNWQREFARFAPSVHVVIHHGQSRAQNILELEKQLDIPGTVVITTYGLVTHSADFLYIHHWAMIVLDEAQAIKNASSKRSMSVREFNADFRVALTGTPIENRLAELWSILDFLNPGLLGSNARFQRIYGIPIERYNDETALERLKNLVSPFILRRVKSDPNIIQDLPDKMEHKIYCSLTREQATLYQAVVNDTMNKIEHATGIARHGQVLALLTRLKQIVDHPALFQKNTAASQDRSGKVQCLIEMLETIIENGEKALIFTQFKEMGDLLTDILAQELNLDFIPFLHGTLSASQRDELVADFQSSDGPPIFILSLKAGGTGLNLTAASHVFHFDRWWNPAVEDQATDRAYRIGQNKNVQVHKFLTLGTLEEKIDTMLEEKKNLSNAIVDSTGAWVTQLDTDALRELFTLSSDAMIDEAD